MIAMWTDALPVLFAGPLTVFDIESLDAITGDAIRLANHCYGCTAGCGSSCQGATE